MENDSQVSSSSNDITPEEQLELLLESGQEDLTDYEYIERLTALGWFLTEKQEAYLLHNYPNQQYAYEQKKIFLESNLKLALAHNPTSYIMEDIQKLYDRGVKLTEEQKDYLFNHCHNQLHYFETELGFLQSRLYDSVFFTTFAC